MVRLIGDLFEPFVVDFFPEVLNPFGYQFFMLGYDVFDLTGEPYFLWLNPPVLSGAANASYAKFLSVSLAGVCSV